MSVAALTPISSNGTVAPSSAANHVQRAAKSRSSEAQAQAQAAQAAASAMAMPMTQQIQQAARGATPPVHFTSSLSQVAAGAPGPAPVAGAEAEPEASAETHSTGLADAAQSLFGDVLSVAAAVHTFGLV